MVRFSSISLAVSLVFHAVTCFNVYAVTVTAIATNLTQMACCYKYQFLFLHSHSFWRKLPFPRHVTASGFTCNLQTPSLLLSSRSRALLSKVTHSPIIVVIVTRCTVLCFHSVEFSFFFVVFLRLSLGLL